MRELPKKRRCHTNPVCLTILWVNFLFKWRISRVTLQSKDCIALLALKCVKFDLLYVAENIAKKFAWSFDSKFFIIPLSYERTTMSMDVCMSYITDH